ncbi:MAG: phosphatase PAP2 family protein [Lysobacteraceae bacterium]|nr:MAG: phosphatase PAP2 family protein [Xanthomonadaceae bacterium]
MSSTWLDSIVTWIGAHPVAAGGLIFLIAFCDALAVVGIVVPALPLLFAVGTLIGLGHLDGAYALTCAALGAFGGDALSYWLGYRWGPAMRQHWLFRRYPQLIDRGENLFRRHGSKGIVIARFVGAVRPFVPAVAGMLRMPLKRYAPASLAAALAWAAAFLAPGWIFGASYDAVAAVADRLALVLLALIAVLALAWAIVLYTYRWFVGHADRLLARALKWTRAHPYLSRYAAPLIHPYRPESASLAMLAICLLAIGWGWFALLTVVLAHGGPLTLDMRVHAAMTALRNPLADRLLAALASLGDMQTLAPPMLLALTWLLWRKRIAAALHWLAAIGFGFMFTAFLGMSIEMPQPPSAGGGFGFPSIPVTMLTICFGFFAVLIARELPGRQRVWPYLLAAVAVALLGFARLYFGAHWLSDIAGGVLFGILWLLVLGIAYRRHTSRSFWMRPLATIFYGSFLLAALWHTPRAVDPLLQRFSTPPPSIVLDSDSWWDEDWAILPAQRDERDASRRWPLDLQIAGPLAPVETRLHAQGWRTQPQANWIATLGLLDIQRAPARQPVLPATLDAEAETLLLRLPGEQRDQIHVLRLWRAPAALDDNQPLWLGTSQTMRFVRPVPSFGLWMPEPDDSVAHARVRKALSIFRSRESPHPSSSRPVLRVMSERSVQPPP